MVGGGKDDTVGGNLAFREKLGFENLAFRGKMGFENLAFRGKGA